MRLYADDSKIIAVIKNEDDICAFQEDIYRLLDWCKLWGISLNFDKCEMIHFGKNPCNQYSFKQDDGSLYPIRAAECVKDLGIHVTKDLKWATQVDYCVGKANRTLGSITSNFSHINAELMKIIYTVFVRPHLEFALPAWRPYLLKDINKMEKVQRRALKLAHELKDKAYDERLKAVGLTELSLRQERGDLIQMFKIVKGIDKYKVDVRAAANCTSADSIQNSPAYGTRSHNMRVYIELVKNCRQRFNFFTNRAGRAWNQLPKSVVESKSVNTFKAKLDKFYSEKELL